MATFGKVEYFDGTSETWSSYIERMDQYFVANDITNGPKKRAILLSCCGPKAYNLLRGLANNKPAEKSYDELVKLMQGHLYPAPNPIAERFKFNNRDRQASETISDYVAVLRKLSEHCNYGDTLDDMIRDRLVCGVRDEKIQQKLLCEKKLTLNSALKIAQAMESATKYSMSIQKHQATFQEGETVNKLYAQPKRDHQSQCYRCGSNHLPDKCPFKDKECFYCHKKGHTVRKCRQKERADGKPRMSNAGINQLQEEEEEQTIETLSLYHLNSARKTTPIKCNLIIENNHVEMEIDTGASMTVMNVDSFKALGQNTSNIKPCKLLLKTFTGEIVKPMGKVDVHVSYGKTTYQLPLIVVPGKTPSLLGRNWLHVIQLDWPSIFHLDSADTNERLNELLQKHDSSFSTDLGCLKNFEVTLPVDSTVIPKFCKARPVPYALKPKIDSELERLVREGIYEPVEYSNWAAPIVPVEKDDGTVRICGDYKQTINQAAPCDNYPIPNTNDLFATMEGGKKFTKLDLSQAYQQLSLAESSREFLTVNTHQGLYRPTRLQYGVHSATGIFQREMDKRLRHIPHTKVRVDDILVSGRDDNEHLKNLEEVLSVIKNAGLHLKRSKCVFLQDEVTYLGFKITKEGVSPLAEKVKAVQKAPTPANISQLKAYLGMLNYYNRYLPRLSSVIEPLHILLRKGQKWHWGKQQENAFSLSKQMLCDAPLLMHFDPNRPIVVSCDASPYGLGAVLAQASADNSEKPVCYISRTLSVAEKNYSQIEKEGLALVWAVKKLHQYLYGQSFTLRTDHKPLLGLFAENKPIPPLSAARVQRWALFLAAYNYTLIYREGRLNGNADCLSRLPLPASTEDISNSTTSVNMLELIHSPVTASEVRNSTSLDPVLSRVYDFIQKGWPTTCQDELLQSYFKRQSELYTDQGCVLWGSRVVIPTKLRDKVLRELHESHPGICRMKALARSYVWWPNMDEQIEQIVRGCIQCEQNKKMPASAPIHAWEYPSGPWQRLHMDFAGPYMGKMFLIVVDAYSKWVECIPMNSSKSKPTIEQLRKIFATHGLPISYVSDNGPCFVSEEFATFSKRNGIQHIFTAPYHPASNGQAERNVQTFKVTLKKIGDEGGDSIETKVSRFLFTYRITPQTTTNCSPAELLFKRRLRSTLTLLKPDMYNKVKVKQTVAERNSHRMRSLREFSVDEKVLLRNYGQGDKWIRGHVFKRTGPVTYNIQIGNNIVQRHIDQMRNCPDNAPDKDTVPETAPESEEIAPTGCTDLDPDVDLDKEAEPSNLHNQNPEVTVRRSNRVRELPKYLHEYEMK